MEKWKDIPAGDLNAATQRLLVALGSNAGMVVDQINLADRGFVAALTKRITAMIGSSLAPGKIKSSVSGCRQGDKKKWKDIPVGQLNEAMDKFWAACDDAAPAVMARIKIDQGFTAAVVEEIIQKIRDSISCKVGSHGVNALDISDWRKFWGVNDWRRFYKVIFTEEQLKVAMEFPWDEDILNGPCPFNPGKLIKQTHFAFLGLPQFNGSPFNLMRFARMYPQRKASYTVQFNNILGPVTYGMKFYSEAIIQIEGFCSGNDDDLSDTPWYEKEPAAETALELRWYLMLKEAIPNSDKINLEEQLKMLPPEYERPTVIAEVAKNLLYYHKTKNRLNGLHGVTCIDRVGPDDPNNKDELFFYIGPFCTSGLQIGNWYGCNAPYLITSVGMGAMRKVGL